MQRYENVIIRASAGTGKTFQLSNRFISLLNAGAPVDQVLATTFTRKAAGEILDRVLARLALAATNDDECRQLAENLQDSSMSRTRCMILLQQLTKQLHRVRISTLDSFFAQVAGTFCLELGLPPGWRIVEPLDDARLRNQALEEVLGSDTSEEVSRLMHLLTRGEAERSVTSLLRQTVDNLYGLFQDTSGEAWQKFPDGKFLSSSQLQETILRLAKAPLPDDKRLHQARQANVDDASAGEWDEFIRKGFAGKIAENNLLFHNKPIPPEVVEACRLLLSHARALFLEQLRHQTWATYELLAKFDAVYQRRKRLSRAMRFDDITRLLSKAAAYRSLDRLDFRLDSQLAHVLLDEFQDTSLGQWQVLRPIAERVVSRHGQQRFFWEGGQTSFFCVGDVKQAIYGWRGGQSELFAAIEAHLPGLVRKSLTQSYRSAPQIIDVVNRVFTNLHRHPNLDNAQQAVDDWSRAFEKHTTSYTQMSGYVALETSPHCEDGQVPEQVLAATAARQVGHIVRQAPGISVGVLARSNDMVARLIFELKRLNIDASEEGGNPLTDSAAVLTVLALLRLADHPGDEIARFHVVQSPLGSIVGLVNWRDDDEADRVAHVVRGQLLNDGFGEGLRKIVEPLLPLGTRRDAMRLRQLVQLAYEFEPHASLRPRDFIRLVEEQRVADPTSSDVRVMTIHQAKGLEFDAVVLTELDRGITGQPAAYVVHQPAADQPIDRVCLYRNKNIQALLPDDLQGMFQQAVYQDVTESLCVMYVALTRAIQALYIIIEPSHQNESNLPRTVAGLLRATLTDLTPVPAAKIVFEHGDRQWWRSAEVTAPLIRGERAPPVIQFSGEKSKDILERTSPSSLEDVGHVSVRDLLTLDNIVARARGSIIHAWLEQIEWLEEGVPPADQLRRIALTMARPGTDLEAELNWFNELLETPAMQNVLRRELYQQFGTRKFTIRAKSLAAMQLQVYRERRFAVRDGQRLLNGIIDRLVLLKDRDRIIAAEIIDFKTDNIAPDHSEQIDALIERYRPQQEAYQQAIRKIYRLEEEQVTARLVFLRASQIHELVAPGVGVDHGS